MTKQHIKSKPPCLLSQKKTRTRSCFCMHISHCICHRLDIYEAYKWENSKAFQNVCEQEAKIYFFKMICVWRKKYQSSVHNQHMPFENFDVKSCFINAIYLQRLSTFIHTIPCLLYNTWIMVSFNTSIQKVKKTINVTRHDVWC